MFGKNLPAVAQEDIVVYLSRNQMLLPQFVSLDEMTNQNVFSSNSDRLDRLRKQVNSAIKDGMMGNTGDLISLKDILSRNPT